MPLIRTTRSPGQRRCASAASVMPSMPGPRCTSLTSTAGGVAVFGSASARSALDASVTSIPTPPSISARYIRTTPSSSTSSTRTTNTPTPAGVVPAARV